MKQSAVGWTYAGRSPLCQAVRGTTHVGSMCVQQRALSLTRQKSIRYLRRSTYLQHYPQCPQVPTKTEIYPPMAFTTQFHLRISRLTWLSSRQIQWVLLLGMEYMSYGRRDDEVWGAEWCVAPRQKYVIMRYARCQVYDLFLLLQIWHAILPSAGGLASWLCIPSPSYRNLSRAKPYFDTTYHRPPTISIILLGTSTTPARFHLYTP